MANTIKIKQSSVASNTPDPGDLEQGELAINTADEKLFSKNSSNTVFEIGAGAGANVAYTNVDNDFTANQTITKTGATTTLGIDVTDNTYNSVITFRSATGARWQIGRKGGTEAGSNVASDFMLARYSDAGSYIDDAITVERATGDVTFVGTLRTNDREGFYHIAPGVESGQTYVHEIGTRWSADHARWYMYPIINGTADFTKELAFDFDLEEWNIEGAPTIEGNAIYHSGNYSGAVTDADNDFSVNQTIDTAGSTYLTVDSGSSAYAAGLLLKQNGVNAWFLAKDSSSGNDDFKISKYSDLGVQDGTPLTIDRTTGDVTLAYDLSVTGDVTGANLAISNWNTAYGWGDHDGLYSLSAHTHGVGLPANRESRNASTIDDIDTQTESGFYCWGASPPTDSSPGWNYGALLAVHDVGQTIQMAFGSSAAGRMAIRRKDSGTWYGWTEFLNEVNHVAGTDYALPNADTTGNADSASTVYMNPTASNASYRMVFRNTSNAAGNSNLYNDDTLAFYYNPSSNILTVGQVTATSQLAVGNLRVGAGRVYTVSTANLHLDAAAGEHTYIGWYSGSGVTYICDGAGAINITLDGSNGDISPTGHLHLDATKRAYFGTDTYIVESSADELGVVVGGSTMLELDQDAGEIQVKNNHNLSLETKLSAIYRKASASSGQVPLPGGAFFTSEVSAVDGALKIALPVATLAQGDMVSFWVDVFQYEDNKSFSFFVSSYVYQGIGLNTWHNNSLIISGNNEFGHTVYLGDDGTRPCLWVGDTTDTGLWQYSKVQVRDLQVGFSADITDWADGWDISMSTVARTNTDDTFVGSSYQGHSTSANLIKVNDYASTTDMRILGSHQTGGQDNVYSNSAMYLNCDTGIINATGFTASGSIIAADYRATSGVMLKHYSAGWATPTQSAIYAGYLSALGDYAYFKAPGNSNSQGILVVADNGLWYGDTDDQAGGALSNDAANPFTDDSGAVRFKVDSSGNVTCTGDLTVSGGQVTINSTSTRDKIRVWSGTPYSIGMQALFTFGGLGPTDGYAMTFQMSNTATRGFWWGDDAHGQSGGAMALTTEGKLTVAHSLRIGYGESDTTTPGATHDLDVSGSIATADVVTVQAGEPRGKKSYTTTSGAPTGGNDGDIVYVY